MLENILEECILDSEVEEIISMSSSYIESRDSSHTCEIQIACKTGKNYKINRIIEKWKPWSNLYQNKREKIITKEDYSILKTKNGFVVTTTLLNRLKEQKKINKQLSTSKKKCSNCKENMNLKQKSKTFEKFWGCSQYPKCKNTEKPIGSIKKKIQQLKNLNMELITLKQELKDYFKRFELYKIY